MAEKSKLPSGGNPQIPKVDGDEPGHAYLDTMTEWRGIIGKNLDELTTKVVPNVEKAVRGNCPFYGAGDGWFLSFHCFTNYVLVTFFNGKSLSPLPPIDAKDAHANGICT